MRELDLQHHQHCNNWIPLLLYRKRWSQLYVKYVYIYFLITIEAAMVGGSLTPSDSDPRPRAKSATSEQQPQATRVTLPGQDICKMPDPALPRHWSGSRFYKYFLIEI